MKRRAFIAAAGTALGGVAGCVGSAGLDESDYDVGMSSVAFLPTRVTVSVGDTVAWGNTGSRNHTVTAYGGRIPDDADYFASGGFDSESAARDGWLNGLSGAIQSGQTYEHTFEVAGEYQYFCIPHEPQGMKGTVVVEG